MTGLPILKSLRTSIVVTNDEVNCVTVTPIKSTQVLFAGENPYFQLGFISTYLVEKLPQPSRVFFSFPSRNEEMWSIDSYCGCQMISIVICSIVSLD